MSQFLLLLLDAVVLVLVVDLRTGSCGFVNLFLFFRRHETLVLLVTGCIVVPGVGH